MFKLPSTPSLPCVRFRREGCLTLTIWQGLAEARSWNRRDNGALEFGIGLVHGRGHRCTTATSAEVLSGTIRYYEVLYYTV